jgi:hypothetical protein
MTTSTPPIDLAFEALPSVVSLVVILFPLSLVILVQWSHHCDHLVRLPWFVPGARKKHELSLYFECGLGFPKEHEVDEELTKELN